MRLKTSAHLQLLVDGATLEVSAHLLQVLHVSGGQGDPDAVHPGLLTGDILGLGERHDCNRGAEIAAVT